MKILLQKSFVVFYTSAVMNYGGNGWALQRNDREIKGHRSFIMPQIPLQTLYKTMLL